MKGAKQTEKRDLKEGKGLSVIKESDQLSPLMQTGNKFSPHVLRGPINRSTEIDIQTIQTALMTQSLEEILLDYKKNPFFRAKLNCLLKNKISQPLTIELTNKEKIGRQTDTLKEAKKVEGKDLKIKLEQIAKAIQKDQQTGPTF